MAKEFSKNSRLHDRLNIDAYDLVKFRDNIEDNPVPFALVRRPFR